MVIRNFPVILVAALTSAPVLSQSFPSKPVRIITAEAGGGLDVTARVTAEGLRETLRQPVVVDNRSGGNGTIAGQSVARAAPDGYTLLLHGTAFWIQPLLQDNVPYDPFKDFDPVTISVMSQNVLVVHPSVAAQSVKELIALAKSRPGQLNYATGSSGSPTHLAAELFKSMTGTNIVKINYKGGNSAVTAIVSGESQVMFANSSVAMKYVKGGQLRALAVAGARPSVLLPELPTIANSGVPGYDFATMFGIFAPAHTPSEIVSKLNYEIVQALRRPDVDLKHKTLGLETIGSSPIELTAQMKSETAMLGRVITSAGIRGE